MSSRMVAIRGIEPTLNTVGRIRASKPKPSERRAGASSPFFRFTSQDREFIEAIAGAHGGDVYEWNEKKAPGRQWAVETESRKIDILIPPNPIYGPLFESWQGKGCDRRCDSTQCEYQVEGPNGPEMAHSASCLCRDELTGEAEEQWLAAGAPLDTMPRACSMVMRVSVILPDLPMAGTWRIDTKGWQSAQKIPAMIKLIESMQMPGLPAGYLYTQQSESFGGRRKFVEILVGVKQTPNEAIALAAGGGQAPALEAGAPALGSGYRPEDLPNPHLYDPDEGPLDDIANENRLRREEAEEIAEAELMDDPDVELPSSLAEFKAWMGTRNPRMTQRAAVEIVTGAYPGDGEFESVNQIFGNKAVLAWLYANYTGEPI